MAACPSFVHALHGEKSDRLIDRLVNVKPAELSIKQEAKEWQQRDSKQPRFNRISLTIRDKITGQTSPPHRIPASSMKISIDSSSLVRFVSSSFFRLPLFIVFEGNERKRKEGEKRGKRKSRRGTLILWNVTKQRLSRRALRSSFSDRLAIDPRQKGIGPTDG